MSKTKVGIIGGSGLGDALCGESRGERISLDTPFGSPSSEIIETGPTERWRDDPNNG